MFAIIFDRATDEELTRAHEIIKARANGWWHHFANIWIVGGGLSAAAWRDAVGEAIRQGPSSSVLVLPLPAEPVLWAYFGADAKDRSEWLHKHLSPPR